MSVFCFSDCGLQSSSGSTRSRHTSVGGKCQLSFVVGDTPTVRAATGDRPHDMTAGQ